MTLRRTLHYVFKIGDRTKTIAFYKNVLGMKILRHEEFEKGCEATCNGTYDGKWSKTMIGYGPEDNHFVVELTYNYGISNYVLGNDYQGITIQSSEAIANAKRLGWIVKQEGIFSAVEAPGGYKFLLIDEPRPKDKDPVKSVSLSSSNLSRSINYWTKIAGMKLFSKEEKSAELGFADNQARLVLVDIGTKIDHASAFGRVANACPSSELRKIEETSKAAGEKILTPYVSLDTPGKATVEVVILGDPDGHEICFVGDEGFRQLSQVDPKSDELLAEAIASDKSDEWFSKKGRSKATV